MKENNDIENDPRDRNKAASNLKFKTVAKGKQLSQIADKPGLNSNVPEAKHSCPDTQTFDDKKGKCVFTSDKEGLNGPTGKNDNDIHWANIQDKGELLQADQRDVTNRAAFNQAVDKNAGIPRKEFQRFQAKSKNRATNV